MTVSSSANLSTTRNEIIYRALRMVGGLGQGETPTTNQITEAALALEHVTKALESDGMPLWAITKTSFSVTASTASYTIGDSQTIDTIRPLRIIQAFNRDTTTNIDIPLRIITRDEYYRLGNKTSTGNPVQLFYDPGRVTGTIYLYPTPDSTTATNNQIHIVYQRPYYDFDDASTEPDFPQEWFDALVYTLASRLAPEYGLPLEERVILWKETQVIKEQALSNGTEEGSLFFQPNRYY